MSPAGARTVLLAILVAGLFVRPLFAQTEPQVHPQPPAAAPAPGTAVKVSQLGISVDRIRRELEDPSSTPLLDDLTRPRFRLTVQGEWIVGLPPWAPPDSVVPGWIQPSTARSHFEYLRMSVPEAFRRSALYPMGVTTNVGSAWGGIQQSIRNRRARKTREEIAEELRRIDAMTSPFKPQ